mmetsp:Transcript_77677/g.242017  ORF Transcript_77677/g.242017 Transcript_77677/m.242017 type:complete len:221 (-) Transcript_77677:512-1174(-)
MQCSRHQCWQGEDSPVGSALVEDPTEDGEHPEREVQVRGSDLVHEAGHLLLLCDEGLRVVLEVPPRLGGVAAAAALVAQEAVEQGDQAPQGAAVAQHDAPAQERGGHGQRALALRSAPQGRHEPGVVRKRQHLRHEGAPGQRRGQEGHHGAGRACGAPAAAVHARVRREAPAPPLARRQASLQQLGSAPERAVRGMGRREVVQLEELERREEQLQLQLEQ